MKKRNATEGPTQRQLRAGELIRHALAEILMTTEITDDALRGEIMTVAEVRVSPDLKHAMAFIATVGAGTNGAVAEALNRHQRFLRGEIARRIELKYAPNVVFRADETAQKAGRIDELLRSPEVTRDLT